ncbi:bifunctional phosphoribosyl-AMP cyclohydrolase/phosphoribosyl-ATP diphosphatase HisIE [Chitinophaga horti]|uniref:Histidine biosynthesis bifunctional protein HisIE n=1 Tax=Chitinophaga horti TaxID=2920382 RepID=A0ABY6J2G2_9BACT|nr:bifunctional phosphoribosyl-AMP cyclohydrolase/phosphoribosyl-ATP diphosphatase HisIE [Chitinophaga horti]UYQ93846.1 bifunctional phosphoribosyl-AMP cyclohydrolase/phosphoribosyl-ATP diphosphatase HisIE [Chitinophaga horti]
MQIDFKKSPDGLVPAIIQDVNTNKVLMLGYMDQAAFDKTMQEGKVTFFSRSKQRLWTKGEESGNFLYMKDVKVDCDNDTLLIKADPVGPVCHTGADTCWNEQNTGDDFLFKLEQVIKDRIAQPTEASYTAKLFARGINKMAQKVGEEAVELVIEAKDNNDHLFLNEGADLLFHYLILLQAKGFSLADIIKVLKERHK